VNVALFAAANGLLLLNLVLLFVGARRPLYDRLAGTVVRLSASPGWTGRSRGWPGVRPGGA
jgi:hypothetical protein